MGGVRLIPKRIALRMFTGLARRRRRLIARHGDDRAYRPACARRWALINRNDAGYPWEER
ncbi:hypothetical protein FRACA_20028 [Frankia canadensis]|uniref:Uncharacterized protein n=1 Tax=Frankia canadensis TaxID=1836972 RepID=A0A2I2KPQ1_9ACTN|nr:hypothetical protein FRACA_20028 [Frankia canadensis]SOU54922.1 hypothetical protein FRACA_20028 [Frankia canadensis]